MEHIEKEVKLLNVDVNKIKRIMEEKNINIKEKYIQDVYTFDLPTVDELYVKYLNVFISNHDVRA